MSVALRQMADAQWPGMATEGLSWITDLTQPAVVWGTWVCPYRVSGYGLPFVMLMLYLKTIELSPGGEEGKESSCTPPVSHCMAPAAYW